MAPGGTYRIDRPIQSLRTGGFAVNAVTGPARTRSFPIQVAREETPAGTACRCKEIGLTFPKEPTYSYDGNYDIDTVCAKNPNAKGNCRGKLLATLATAWRDESDGQNVVKVVGESLLPAELSCPASCQKPAKCSDTPPLIYKAALLRQDDNPVKGSVEIRLAPKGAPETCRGNPVRYKVEIDTTRKPPAITVKQVP